jgi:hypothetical protein
MPLDSTDQSGRFGAFSLLLRIGQIPRSVAFLDGKATRIVALWHTPTVKMLWPAFIQRVPANLIILISR